MTPTGGKRDGFAGPGMPPALAQVPHGGGRGTAAAGDAKPMSLPRMHDQPRSVGQRQRGRRATAAAPFAESPCGERLTSARVTARRARACHGGRCLPPPQASPQARALTAAE